MLQRARELRFSRGPGHRPLGMYEITKQLRSEGFAVSDGPLREYLRGLASAEADRRFVEAKEPEYYERAADVLFKMLGKRRSRFVPMEDEPGGERYAVFSDLHVPFHDQEALIQAVEEAQDEGCTTLIIGGDGLDFYRISRYPKSKLMPFREELAQARVVLEYLSASFGEVRILLGNHDGGRWERAVGEQISEEIRWLVRSPWEVLLEDLPNVRLVGHEAPFGASVGWLYQLGDDAIITHCEVSSSQQGVNLDKLKGWVTEWSDVIGLCHRPRLITTGHTHRATAHHEHDKLLIETGTLASWDAQDYQLGAGIKNRKPGVKAWTLLVQNDGVTDLKASGVRRLHG